MAPNVAATPTAAMSSGSGIHTLASAAAAAIAPVKRGDSGDAPMHIATRVHPDDKRMAHRISEPDEARRRSKLQEVSAENHRAVEMPSCRLIPHRVSDIRIVGRHEVREDECFDTGLRRHAAGVLC